MTQGTEIKKLEGHTGAINALAYSPKGDRLITASADGSVRVWDLSDGMSKAKLDYGSPATSLSLTKDGVGVAVGGVGKAVKIFTLAENRLAATIAPAEVRGLAWNHEGTQLVIGGADHQTRLYGADGKLLEFFSHRWPVSAVAFLPDGKRIVTSSADNLHVCGLRRWFGKPHTPGRLSRSRSTPRATLSYLRAMTRR